MPYKFEYGKKKIQDKDNNTKKLTENQKINIRMLYSFGTFSQRELAKMFKVSRRTIQFCISPEKYETAKQQRRGRAKDGRYYDRDKQREYVKKYRKHKKILDDNQELL